MDTIAPSRIAGLAVVIGLSFVLLAPVAGRAGAPNLALAPAPSWDETSGYGSVEAIRAGLVPTWDAISGYGSVERVRAALAPTWDQTSGYGSVEAIRAALAGSLIP